MSAPTDAPIARREPTVWDDHGRQRPDDYAWMSSDAAGLLDYLKAERAYYDAETAHTKPLQAALFEEMSGRVAPADSSVGWRHGDYTYSDRQLAGQQYSQFCRSAGAATEVVLDLNVLGGESAYAALGVRVLSPDGSRLAYSIDLEGDETYELRIRDLTTGSDLPDRLDRTYYGCAWSEDGATLLYVVPDEAYRPFRVMRHRIGTPQGDDTIAFEDSDDRFYVTVSGSRSGKVVVISSSSTNTSEVNLLLAGDVHATPWPVAPRQEGVQYTAEHVPGPDGGQLYIVTNDDAVEFRLMRAALHGSNRADWVEVIGEDPAERLIAAAAFDSYVVLTFRRDGDQLLRTLELATGAMHDHDAAMPAGTIRLSCTDDGLKSVRDPFTATAVTVVTESLIEPPRWWSLDLATGERTLLKTTSTPGYDSSRYVTTRITVTAADGAPIPVTLAHRADVPRDGSAPCLLYGYGSYEVCIDPTYKTAYASLLDRGVVFAIAHVRGGGERGRTWWIDGHLHAKRNTFTDFISAADALADQGYVDGARIAARGRSAGGLLVGASLAIAPQRWSAVIAEVPFVDCVTTMLDASLPLTAGEWEEWGDPRTAADFDYMVTYSPYENVPLGPRPAILATGSLHDSRVMVREPAKWVAKLRATQTDASSVLFRAEFGSGAHSGPSGRYDRLGYDAEIVAFILDSLGAV